MEKRTSQASSTLVSAFTITTFVSIISNNSHQSILSVFESTLPRAKTSLQLAIICSLSTSEIHSPNKASTVPAFLPSAAAAMEEEEGEEEEGGKSVWILRGVEG